MKYRGFLSYSHRDRKWARWLHRKLESYRLPKRLTAIGGDDAAPPRRISPIFRDRDELPSSASLSGAVDDALRESEWLIVVCSPHAAASRWVNEEIRTFRRLGRSDRILCFVVGGEPLSGNADECIPEALTEPTSPGDARIEPVAADARPQGDGRASALLKLISGMLGVGFDVLKQREQNRRNRRLVVATAASLAVAALTITLAINATIARDEAELRRVQAENLIDFMLGDLHEQLREIGRLDLYQRIGDEALEYFAALSGENVSDNALRQRAQNLRQIGDVRLDQGDLAEALVAFEESLSITARLAERDRSNAENQVALANSHFYIGAVHWRRGELAEARRQFERVVLIVDAVAASDPENTAWLLERGYGYTNLGRVLELEGVLDEALRNYEVVMGVNERLVELEPDDPEWSLELGFAHNNIGKLVTALGRLDEAENHYRRDLAIKTEVLASGPQHNIRRSYVAVSEHFLGQLLVMRGKHAEAQAHLSAALEIFESLIDFEPNHVEWQGRLANTRRELGQVLLSAGRTAEALALVGSSVEIFSDLVADDEANVGSRRELARGLLVLADAAAGRGRLDVAGGHLRSARSHLDVLVAREPTSRDTQQLAIQADVSAALIADARQERDSAEGYYGDALRRVESHFSESSDPRVLALEASALAGLGRADEAAAIERRLMQMGYARDGAI